MPKRVDREARRTEIAEALLRVAARDGLLSVSLRHVAAEAGVSMGMVQYHFRTKDEMLSFALGVVSENVQRRLAESGDASPEQPRRLARALLMQMLPLDEERRREAHAALAYAAYTAVRPTVNAELRDQMRQLREFLADAIEARGATTVPPTTAAAGLLALVDGLMVEVLGGYLDAEDAVAALDAQLESAFGAG